MPAEQLSRWTMAWYASALVFLITALGAVVLGLGGPVDWRAGTGLAVVHLFALGWLGQAMLGSLMQLLPVLMGRKLMAPPLALPVLILMISGIAALAAGFLALAGWHQALWLLALAPALLGGGFALAGIMLGGTVIAAGAWRQIHGAALLLALLALVLLWLSGLAMAWALAGFGAGSALLGAGLPFHMLAGIGGWLGVATFAVSYRLFSMFLGTSEQDCTLRRKGLLVLGLAVGLIGAGLVTVLAGGDSMTVLAGVMLSFALAVGLYLADIQRMWRKRRQPSPEVNMQVSRIALIFLAVTTLLLPVALIGQGVWTEVAVFLALAGWLSTMTLAQMLKIVSFLTWLQVFLGRIGRHPVPMAQDLLNHRLAKLWLLLWIIGTILGSLALVASAPLAFRAAAVLMLIAALGVVRELLAIRKLDYVRPDLRPILLPPLIFPPL